MWGIFCRDAKDVMRRAADKFERDFDRALCNGDIPFLETLITSGAVDVTNRFKVRGKRPAAFHPLLSVDFTMPHSTVSMYLTMRQPR
jgi:hypothetical protein